MNDKLTTKEKIEIAIQSGLELIPYVGGALSSVYFATKQEKRFKRLEASSGGKTPPLTTVPSKLGGGKSPPRKGTVYHPQFVE